MGLDSRGRQDQHKRHSALYAAKIVRTTIHRVSVRVLRIRHQPFQQLRLRYHGRDTAD